MANSQLNVSFNSTLCLSSSESVILVECGYNDTSSKDSTNVLVANLKPLYGRFKG